MSGNGTGRPGQAPANLAQPGREPDVIMFGQIARDLVLVVGAVPGPSQSADVCQRREMLGGKGANQAVALAQLGMQPALAGVVGEDWVGQRLLAEASRDRVDVSAVVRRSGACLAGTQPGHPEPAPGAWTRPRRPGPGVPHPDDV